MDGRAVAQAIEGDGGNDDDADDNLLHIRRPAHLLRAVSKQGHNQRAQNRAKNRAFAAGQTRAADDDSRNNVKFSPDVYCWVALPQAPELQSPARPKNKPARP